MEATEPCPAVADYSGFLHQAEVKAPAERTGRTLLTQQRYLETTDTPAELSGLWKLHIQKSPCFYLLFQNRSSCYPLPHPPHSRMFTILVVLRICKGPPPLRGSSK